MALAIRKNLRLEQERFAEVCDVDVRTIRNWEAGRWGDPAKLLSLKHLLKLPEDQESALRWFELRRQVEDEVDAARRPERPTQVLGFRRLYGDVGPSYTFLPGSEPVIFEDEKGRRYSQTLRGSEPQTLMVPDGWRLVQPTEGP